MIVGQRVRHLRSNRNGIVAIVNTTSRKAKIRFEDDTLCNMQSFDNFMILKSQSESPKEPTKRSEQVVSFDPNPTEIHHHTTQAPRTEKDVAYQISKRVPYETILSKDITFQQIHDRQKYPTIDLATLTEEQFRQLQELRNLLPGDEDVSCEYWPHLFGNQSNLWGFRPTTDKIIPKTETQAASRKRSHDDIVKFQCAHAMKDLYFGVSMLGGGSSVMYP